MYCKTYEYKNVDNCSILLDVYNSPINNSPVIIYIHGGGLILGSRKNVIEEQINLYNMVGFTVVSIDYRLAPETKLEQIVEDVRDAIEWVKNEGKKLFDIDIDKIVVIGGSAGGYLSLMTGTFKHRPKAIVSFYGYGDILGKWSLRPSEFYCEKVLVTKEQAYDCIDGYILSEGDKQRFLFYLYCRQNGVWIKEVSGYNTLIQRKKIIPFCPIYNIDKDFPPTLLLHGDKDNDVPYEQSVTMSDELSKFGICNELITIKGGEHEFDQNMDSYYVKKAFESVFSFLTKHLK